jgi:hypothetical protein
VREWLTASEEQGLTGLDNPPPPGCPATEGLTSQGPCGSDASVVYLRSQNLPRDPLSELHSTRGIWHKLCQSDPLHHKVLIFLYKKESFDMHRRRRRSLKCHASVTWCDTGATPAGRSNSRKHQKPGATSAPALCQMPLGPSSVGMATPLLVRAAARPRLAPGERPTHRLRPCDRLRHTDVTPQERCHIGLTLIAYSLSVGVVRLESPLKGSGHFRVYAEHGITVITPGTPLRQSPAR